MSKDFLYLIGVPGAGKTTIVNAALSGLNVEQVSRPVPHCVYKGGVQLGRLNGIYSGTDALSMSIQPLVIDWLNKGAPGAIVAEGDRLANNSFFQAVQEAGYTLTVAMLTCDEWVAQNRRALRGSNQKADWLKGRRTKVHNLVNAWVDPAWILDGNQTIAALADRLSEHPVFKRLRGAA